MFWLAAAPIGQDDIVVTWLHSLSVGSQTLLNSCATAQVPLTVNQKSDLAHLK